GAARVRPRIRSTVLVHDGAGRPPIPVGALEKVHEVDPERVFGLPNLPVLASGIALQALTESSHLVGQRLVRSRSRQEAAHPPYAIRRCLLLDQLRLQDEFPKLLQRRVQFPHRSLRAELKQLSCRDQHAPETPTRNGSCRFDTKTRRSDRCLVGNWRLRWPRELAPSA